MRYNTLRARVLAGIAGRNKLLIKLKDSIVKTVESFFVLLIEFKRLLLYC